MRLVISGCGGFIGSHLLDDLFRRGGIDVDGWDPETDKISAHLSDPHFNLHRTLVDSEETWKDFEDAVQRADAVINLAAICNPSQYNTKPLAVIKANFFDVYPAVEICARHNKWLIHFSTSEVYGRTLASYLPDNKYDNPDLFELDEETTPLIMGPIQNQRWSYACAKQLIERFIFACHYETGMPFTIVRPLNFFGPKMDFIPGRDGDGIPRVLACFMTSLMNGEPMRLVDGGNRMRTIVSIHDAIRSIWAMLQRPERAKNQVFNIGNRENEVTIRELAELMRNVYAEITGDDAFRHHPIESVTAEEFYGPGYEDCDRRMPNLDRANTLLDWTPRINLRETLIETMRFYHEHYATRKPTRSKVPMGVHEVARSEIRNAS
jgi:UDP-apiose/xylose synthase